MPAVPGLARCLQHSTLVARVRYQGLTPGQNLAAPGGGVGGIEIAISATLLSSGTGAKDEFDTATRQPPSLRLAFTMPRRAPDGMLWLRVTVAGGPRKHAPLYVESEEELTGKVVQREPDMAAFVEELVRPCAAHGVVINLFPLPREVEGILVVRARKRVHRVPAVAEEVVALGRRNEEREQVRLGEKGAERMDAWSTVAADGGEEGQPDAELVQQVPAQIGEIRPARTQFPPSDHSNLLHLALSAGSPLQAVIAHLPGANLGQKAHFSTASIYPSLGSSRK